MFLKTNSKLLFSFLMLFVLSVGFYSCTQGGFETENTEVQTSIFEKHLDDNTQRFVVQDEGEGTYHVVGEQGTRVNIKDALVDASGQRVRGEVEVVLIEIYSVEDMILNRKQTLADYDGQYEILESGGEVFVKVYQDGKELFADGNGEMNILLPTENTGGAKEGMELFYGEEVDEQVIWKPTGTPVKVVDNQSRNGSDYLVIIQNILGWINVDIIYGAGGEDVECVEVVIECDEICDGMIGSTTVALHVSAVNSAFELTYDPSSGTYKFCGVEAPLAIGGLTVSFIVIIECKDGSVYSAIVTVTVSNGYHLEVINCDQFTPTNPDELEQQLAALL